ncbi:hypothetical protein Tco_0798642 [Tanacetum coccineum]
MLEDFSSNAKDKRTEAYTLLCRSGYVHVVGDYQRAEDFDTLGFPALKYSYYIGLNSNSNSCCDVAVLFAGGTTFGTSFELDGSLLWLLIPSSKLL